MRSRLDPLKTAEIKRKSAEKNREKRLAANMNAEEKARKKAWNAADYQRHKIKRVARQKEYVAQHKHEIRRYNAAWKTENKVRVLELEAAYRERHPVRVRVSKKAWYEKNKEQWKVYGNARRAREVGAEGSFTKEEVRELLEKQRGKCAVCRTDIRSKMHRDHIQPIAVGGTNYISNIQLLCPDCNFQKNAKDPVQFMQSRGFLL